MGKYTEQYTQIHNTKKYGISSERKAQQIRLCIPATAAKVLDYGCGQSRLLEILGVKYPFYYDPSVKGRDIKPTTKMDLVICTDVLEHVPEEELDEVLKDIFSYADRAIFIISEREAKEILPNGENAHCTVKPKQWWINLLFEYVDIVIDETFLSKENNYFGLVAVKSK